MSRFWPSLKHYRTSERIEVHLCALRLEAVRASRWMWIPVVGEIFAHIRAHAWWAQKLRYF